MSFNPQFARLGEILVHMGKVTEDQIKEALVIQNNFRLKIGETLVKLGYLTETFVWSIDHSKVLAGAN